MEEIIMEPKVVVTFKGQKLYWCPARQMQMVEVVCKQKYFAKGKRVCRLCLGMSKGKHWPEPWASLEGAK